MNELSFFIVAAIFILLLILNSFIRKNAGDNAFEIRRMQNMLEEIKKRLTEMEAKTNSSAEPKASEVKPTPAAAPQIMTERKPEPVAEPIRPIAPVAKPTPASAITEPVANTIPTPRPIPPTPRPTPPPAPQKSKSFFERYPDLEKFIGENLINKIGIVILVLGIAYLVKYAIDKNWINEVGRVAIGILSAGGLLGLAHKLRKDYKPFSSVLIGGGLAILYFTFALAYHTEGYPLYQQQTATFIILIFVTLFAVFLSVLYDRMEIAILAILGGFCAPMMVSNGSGNYIVLFSYMMLLNVGMLVLSYYKKWRAVNIVAFAFTVLLFSGWLISELLAAKYSAFAGAFFFATGFYVIFFLMNIIYNFKHNLRFKVGDISMLLSNTAIYFTCSMILLSRVSDGDFKGLFSVILGAFNFVFAYITHKRQNTDSNLLFLLIGLVFTFGTLAIPLQLEGNYITLFWAIESILLLWLSQKSGFKILQLGSVIVTFLMLISLGMDWSANYHIVDFGTEGYVKHLGLVLNKMMLTTLISGGALCAALWLAKRESEEIAWVMPAYVYRWALLIAAIAVFYTGGAIEVNYQAYHNFLKADSLATAFFTYNTLFVLGLLLFAYKLNNTIFSIAVASISTLFTLVFLGMISSVYASTTLHFLNGVEPLSNTLLLFRWISIAAVYAIAILTFKLVNTANRHRQNQLSMLNIGMLVFTALYLLSADLDTLGILITRSQNALLQTQRTGYAVLWGLSSFILMIIGMKKKVKFVRILSLALFAITIVKLFVFDIKDISEAGKIIAFILLGVLLLIISFMYQKVKKLIVDDDFLKKTADPENPTSTDL